jgi:hypothetical protein
MKNLTKLLLTTFIGAVTFNTSALPAFTSNHIFDSTVEVMGLNHVDFNGDGTIDILTREYILLNDGDGHFTQHVLNTPITENGYLFDIDGNGEVDFVRTTGSNLVVTPFDGDMTVLASYETINEDRRILKS